MAECLNCGVVLSSGVRFCGQCGQRVETGRLALREIGRDLIHALFHVDHSALALIVALILEPGEVARRYVAGMRRRYFGPFAFLVVIAALASAVIALTGFAAVESSAPSVVGDFLQRHVNLIFFAQVPLLAACHRMMGSGGRYNYAEHLVLAAYTTAMWTLFYVLLVVPAWFLLKPGPTVMRVAYFALFPLFPVYFGAASAQFLPQKRPLGFIKGASAALLTRAATFAVASIAARVLAS
jgi:hypothetical protein